MNSEPVPAGTPVGGSGRGAGEGSDPSCSPARSPVFLLILTSLVAFVVVTGALFSGVAAWIDQGVGSWLNSSVSESVRSAALHLTVLGNTLVVIAMAAVTGGLLLLIGRRPEAVFLLTSVPVVGVAVWAGKQIVARPRPDAAMLIPFTDSHAYPSGHAAMAAALATALTVVVCRMVSEGSPVRRRVILMAVLFATSIAMTRLLLGVHYVTDVLSGLALGLCLVAVCAHLLDRVERGAVRVVRRDDDAGGNKQMKSMKMTAWFPVALVSAGALTACDRSAEAETLAAAAEVAGPTGAPACIVEGVAEGIASEVRETSGLAVGRGSPGVFWTHNDAGNDPVLHALDTTGQLIGTVRVTGAELEDWEDIEAAPCDGGDCLFIADIGDNDGEREDIVVYRVAEPDPRSGRSSAAIALRATYPDGPRDAEALFVHPTLGIHVVTKGRRGPVELYRYPTADASEGAAVLERVTQLFPYPSDNDDRITAATLSPDGAWVAIRSYRDLHFFHAEQLVAGDATPAATIDLSPLDLEQGESLAMTADGSVWMTSEAESEGDPVWSRIQCSFP